jgi:glutamyl-tRNA synthetase
MHIGTLRTALWNYYMARQSGGVFYIRIEDTDQERFVPGSVEALLKTLQETGVDWDEGPVLNADGTLGEKGEYGPYTQTKRLDIYTKYANQLLEQGDAYHCFCTAERLTQMREAQQATKQTPKYDRHCLKLSPEEVQAKLLALQPGDAHVIRMKIPAGISEFTDAIRGKISFNNDDVDDQVIVKTNGIPTYHLAVVVDDYLMKTSHVLRGEEWLSSTPKQIILCSMLGIEMPIYAHVPLLLNPDKTKLSKRKGDVSAEGYLQKGYLPVALKNFLGTLGFNPTGDREIYTEQELITLFDISKVNRAGAVVNAEKLDWMNAQYMKSMEADTYLAGLETFLGRALESDIDRRIALIEKQRANTLLQVKESIEKGIPFDDSYEPQILVWKKSDASDSLAQVKGVQEIINGGVGDTVASIESTIKSYIEKNGLQNGNVLWPLRVSLSGAEKSLSPFELLWILPADESRRRIALAIQKLESLV